METQTSGLPVVETEASTSTQSDFQTVVHYNETLSSEGEPSEAKPADGFFEDKIRSPQLTYQTDLTNPTSAQSYVNAENVHPTSSKVNAQPITVRPYKYDAESSQQESSFTNNKVQQQPFKMPIGNSKTTFKQTQYQKISPACSLSNQYNRIQQDYDLAVTPQESLLPEMSVALKMMKDPVRSTSLPVMNKPETFAVPKVNKDYLFIKYFKYVK